MRKFSLGLGAALVVGLGLTGPAAAKPEKEEFPISGQVTLSYQTRHSAFVPTGGDAAFGAAASTLGVSVFWTPESIPDLTLSGNFSFTKAVFETYDRAFFQFQTQPGITQVSDLNFGANWNFARAGAFLFTAGLQNTATFSNFSKALGIVFSTGPSLGVTWIGPGGLIGSAGAWYSLNITSSATAEANCEKAPDTCEVSGKDLGVPSQLYAFGGNAGLSYQVVSGLFVSGGYFMQNWVGQADFSRDQYTSPYAQTGTQSQALFHGTSFGIRYQLKQLGGGAAEAFNETTHVDDSSDSWTNHIAIGLSMLTFKNLYTLDNESVSNPFFDTESNLHHRTLYSVVLTGIM